MPGVIAGTALVFILSLGFYITPALLGGGKVIMIAVLIEQQVRAVPGVGVRRRAVVPAAGHGRAFLRAAQSAGPAGNDRMSPTAHRTSRARNWLLPALRVFTGLVFLFLMLPLLIVFPISFSSSAYLRFPPPGYSLRWYRGLCERSGLDRRNHKEPEDRRPCDSDRTGAWHVAGVFHCARALSRARGAEPDFSPSHHRALDRLFHCGLWAVRKAEAHRTMAGDRTCPRRSGHPLCDYRRGGRPEDLRCCPGAGGNGTGGEPAYAPCGVSRCRRSGRH